jgi:hypothetical protein
MLADARPSACPRPSAPANDRPKQGDTQPTAAPPRAAPPAPATPAPPAPQRGGRRGG